MDERQLKRMQKKTEEWSCPDCPFQTEWSYSDMVNLGMPVCPDCDADLELVEDKKVQITVHMFGENCTHIDTNLLHYEWEYKVVNHKDNPDLPDDHNPFQTPGE